MDNDKVIKENMYIRTINGYIGKVMGHTYKTDVDYNSDDVLGVLKVPTGAKLDTRYFSPKKFDEVGLDEIENESSEIIDLIKIGDLVNGMPVVAMGEQYHNRENMKVLYLGSPTSKIRLNMVYNDMIKTVVCKEYIDRGRYYCE